MLKRVQNKKRDVILDPITEGVFTVDSGWRITSFNRADVFFGDDNVVKPNPADMARGGLGDIEQYPEEIQLQFLCAAPLKTLKGHTFGVGIKAVPYPFTFRKSFSKMTYYLAVPAPGLTVNPDSLLAIAFGDGIVHFHHQLDTYPFSPLDFQARVVNEVVSP